MITRCVTSGQPVAPMLCDCAGATCPCCHKPMLVIYRAGERLRRQWATDWASRPASNWYYAATALVLWLALLVWWIER